jgi:hypothetical protein
MGVVVPQRLPYPSQVLRSVPEAFLVLLDHGFNAATPIDVFGNTLMHLIVAIDENPDHDGNDRASFVACKRKLFIRCREAGLDLLNVKNTNGQTAMAVLLCSGSDWREEFAGMFTTEEQSYIDKTKSEK